MRAPGGWNHVLLGDDNDGQLGQGNVASSPVPLAIAGLSGVASIAASAGDTFAILGDNSIRAWGFNESWTLGDGTRTTRFLPVPVIVQ